MYASRSSSVKYFNVKLFLFRILQRKALQNFTVDRYTKIKTNFDLDQNIFFSEHKQHVTEGIMYGDLFVYKSSSSSGRAVCCASSSSCSYCLAKLGSICTSGGARAGLATNSKLGSPTSLRANQRNGFSKL